MSEYNIDSTQFWNNTFKIEVPTTATTSTISITLTDGIYAYADINRSIQTALVNAGAWSIQRWRNWSTYYDSSPRIIIDNAYFGKVVGLTTGINPSASATVASAQLSNIIPQIEPSSSYVVRCNLFKNEYVASGDILSAFDRGDASVGQLISYKPSQYAWMSCHHGSRSSLTNSIFNQNDQKVKFRDPSVSIMLLLRPKK
ncbi:unnamed protein product [Phytophthora lilii]|uniref:Unnamed protein product n=1 Tax=Phytophthora lilii TaxID=2077276 RepID=A0A9W6XAR7_9STRA|nr:unnamed protein product [Phytophthora lilii]